jgi:hypothetical protein
MEDVAEVRGQGSGGTPMPLFTTLRKTGVTLSSCSTHEALTQSTTTQVTPVIYATPTEAKPLAPQPISIRSS